jgi:hypothetical protein
MVVLTNWQIAVVKQCGGSYLNDQAGHFLCVHPTCGQLHLPVGAEIVLDDFQRGIANETVN